ncbi:hypothetical protein PSV3_00027 [Septimatrevirus PSV31]|uniref:Uncharacterized protein n=1 Tax=Pseudomonas phage PSV3 TaxID=3003632 RepID=A0AAE9VZR3_9CAUD|nr:hypothetical protein PM408_gp27 [Pseudomonas phage PSV3]WBF76729.1 hypothetical protein PSV3_00027 [Pseudomonas phage PSV3]
MPTIKQALLAPVRLFLKTPTEDIPKLPLAFVANQRRAKVPTVPAVIRANAIFVYIFFNALRKCLWHAGRVKVYALFSCVGFLRRFFVQR